MRGLERRDDSFGLAQFVKGLEREIIIAVVILDATDFLKMRMLGSDRRVVETGGDRMRFGDLTEFVLQHHRTCAVQHAERAAGESRGVCA